MQWKRGSVQRRGGVAPPKREQEPISDRIQKYLSHLENLKKPFGVFVNGRHQPLNTLVSHSFARLVECLSILCCEHFVRVSILF